MPQPHTWVQSALGRQQPQQKRETARLPLQQKIHLRAEHFKRAKVPRFVEIWRGDCEAAARVLAEPMLICGGHARSVDEIVAASDRAQSPSTDQYVVRPRIKRNAAAVDVETEKNLFDGRIQPQDHLDWAERRRQTKRDRVCCAEDRDRH